MFFWPSPHSKVFPLGCFVLCMLLCACVFCTDWACYWVLPQVEPLCVFREVFGYSREVSERTVDLSNTWTATTPRAGRYSMDRGHLIYKEKKRLLRKKRKKKAPRGRLGKLGGDKRRKQNTFRPVTVRNEIVTGDTSVNTKKETGILTWSQNVSWFIFNMRKKTSLASKNPEDGRNSRREDSIQFWGLRVSSLLPADDEVRLGSSDLRQASVLFPAEWEVVEMRSEVMD